MKKKESYSVSSNPVQAEFGKLNVLFAGESQTKPEHALGPKIYDYYLLHAIVSGHGTFRTETDVYELGPGDCFLIHPGQLVSYVSCHSDPWKYLWVAFTGETGHSLVESAGFLPGCPVLNTTNKSENSKVPEYIHHIQEHFHMKQESAHTAAVGFLHLIWAEIMNCATQPSRLTVVEPQVQRTVKQMINYMTSQYAHPVSIEQMCVSLGYNRAYLSRIFKKETGISPVTYLLKLRIDQAKRLLRERPELSVEQISSSVGLTDPLYFSRQFKRFCGQSPTSYRKEMTGI
ncbi:AraC family transcriptional regulator [Paenibacillus sp. N3/727]|uniref:AraC family transcriptional regulator n=1 Tax=Paenibacillus sp. N3/727 TaxID=2925845 RepID=UPI001F531473|nr:AraC family transcriptional regulator [Paenibacillus sp. N3/727]UNK19921.1 AraC family transcriptional regulator [Paenibacillus sp. N3/727]